MKIAKTFVLLILLSGLGCSLLPGENCPSLSEEPISGCRARAKCRQKKTVYGVGLAPSGQLADDFGLAPDNSPVTDKYLECVSKDLEQQKSLYQIKLDETKTIGE